MPNKQQCLCLGLLAAITFLSYVNTLNCPLILDDPLVIEEASQKGFYQLISPSSGLRPLYKLSIALNLYLTGRRVWAFHLVSIVFHVFNALLLYSIVSKTLQLESISSHLRKHANWLGFFCALIWAVHPLNTQAVTYLSQRCELMMALFYLLTMRLLLAATARNNSWFWQLAALASLFCGLISKEAMISAPLVLLVYDRIFLSRTWKQLFKAHRFFYIGMVLIFSLPTCYLIVNGEWGNYLSYLSERHGIRSIDYLLTQSEVVLYYLKLTVLPTGLCFDYNWPLRSGILQVWLPCTIWLLFLAGLVRLMIRTPALGFSLLFFVINILPRSSVVVSPHVAVEYRMYLPLAGLIVFAVLGSFVLTQGTGKHRQLIQRLLLAFGVAIVLVFMGLTINRNRVYADRFTLWQDTLTKSPANFQAMNYLGIELSQRGKFGEAKRLFGQALKLNPGNIISLNNLANANAELGNLDEAISLYNQALRWEIIRDKDRVKRYLQVTHHNLAKLYFRKQQIQQSLDHFEKALGYGQENAALLYDMGYFYLCVSDIRKAKSFMTRATELDPGFAPAFNGLGTIAVRQRNYSLAKEYFQKALQLSPGYEQARRNLEQLLASQRESGSRN